jgi:hypothetical protein
MKVFRHRDFSTIVRGVQMASHHPTVRKNYPDYGKFCDNVAPVLAMAEHLVVDIDVLPQEEAFQAIRLPYDNLLIGLESEVVEKRLKQKDSEIQAIDAYHVLRVTDDILDEDVDEKMKEADYLIFPYIRDLSMKTGFKWTPTGARIAIFLHDDDPDNVFISYVVDIIHGCPFHMPDSRKDELAQIGITYLNDISSLLSCSNVEVMQTQPSGPEKMMARKKQIPIKDYNSIKLPQPIRVGVKDKGGTHASPRFHTRRGHYRTYHRGQRYESKVWIRPCSVGDPKTPHIRHDYEIRVK